MISYGQLPDTYRTLHQAYVSLDSTSDSGRWGMVVANPGVCCDALLIQRSSLQQQSSLSLVWISTNSTLLLRKSAIEWLLLTKPVTVQSSATKAGVCINGRWL